MITIKKIRTLKPRVQIRKCGNLMHMASEGTEFHPEFRRSLLEILLDSELVPETDKSFFVKAFQSFDEGEMRAGEDIYYKVLEILGEEVADWDFTVPGGKLDASKRQVFPHRLLLDGVRSPYNIGAIFRSAESFGVEHIYLTENCGDVKSPRCERTSCGAVNIVPYTIISSYDEVKGPFFALETGGTAISSFAFPEDGVCIIGSEESGVSPKALALASERVTIPTYGAKGSLNVSVAAGIMLSAWASASLSALV